MVQEGFIDVEGGKVWYEIDGNKKNTPLIVLHGGPGSAHFSMKGLAALSDDRQVVFYDQLGCGNSDRPSDTTLWQTERFVRELAVLREKLELDKVHILGHSWGTMLLADYLLTKPKGVASAIFSSPCLSARRWADDAIRLRKQLPADVQATLTKCEENENTDSDEYREAEKVYMKQFVCRVEISKEDRELREFMFGKEVYNFMWGPSEFYPTGNLKEYDRTNRLHEIEVPSLFTCGHYDEATPESTAYYHSLVPDSQFHIFENSAHSPLREQLSDYLQVIRTFLQETED